MRRLVDLTPGNNQDISESWINLTTSSSTHTPPDKWLLLTHTPSSAFYHYSTPKALPVDNFDKVGFFFKKAKILSLPEAPAVVGTNVRVAFSVQPSAERGFALWDFEISVTIFIIFAFQSRDSVWFKVRRRY